MSSEGGHPIINTIATSEFGKSDLILSAGGVPRRSLVPDKRGRNSRKREYGLSTVSGLPSEGVVGAPRDKRVARQNLGRDRNSDCGKMIRTSGIDVIHP